MRDAGLDVRLTVTGAPVRLEDGLELAAYRIVQEALSNTLKHAPAATRAEVRLRWDAAGVEIEVSDDGRSVPAARVRGGGQGIAGMRHRAAAYGGSLAAGPRTSGGWRVHARLTGQGVRG